MKKETQISYQERILRVLVYIQQHLDEPLPLEKLAQVACFSPYHFHRIFRGMVGESVAGHIRRLRLERAAQKLRLSKKQSVLDLALDAGFQTAESFTRAFRDQFEITPSTYRKKGVVIVKNNPQPTPPEESTLDVKIVELPEQRVAFVRNIGPYQECGRAWDTLCIWAGTNGYLQPGTQFIGLCHDAPEVTPPENIRYDACITIDQEIEPEGEVGMQTIAGGLYAVTTHYGSYNNLEETYTKLCGQWAPENNVEIRSLPGREVYLNTPDETPEDELITDIYVPIEK